jgi:asparagine synthase (glutamine-hydrolysing)
MCGIAGIVQTDRSAVNERALEEMTRTLAHRGPDGQGLYVDGWVGLGHRRLSIIDLEGGKQPMANEDGQVWVTFNGEIYNYLELQKELEKAGHRFHTSSDTEVIVHAYEEWGANCVDHFRGMFAFAVHDRRHREVFLARDRVGIKPLVYSVEPGRVAFASELQAIAALPDISLVLNPDALDQYLQLQYIPAPATIYKNVYKLPPGHHLVIGHDGKIRGPVRYWDVQFIPDRRRRLDDWVEELDAVIRESVRLQLRSDVPFGAFLSGGVDSSVVTAYMAELLPHPVKTFTIAFEEEEFSEARYAREAARRCGTDHHEEMVRPDALAILPDLVRHYGEPFGDNSAIPTYYVSQMARRHVKMVLSGDGGDENFAGYNHYMSAACLGKPSFREPVRLARRLVGNAGRALGVLAPRSKAFDIWVNSVCVFSAEESAQILGRVRNDNLLMVTDEPKENGSEFCGDLQYLDIKNFLPFSVLAKVDIASMCHGLEVRVPLLDHPVVELAARIPAEFKVVRNREGKFGGKHVLKRLGERIFHPSFLNRAKMGFTPPIRRWFEGARLKDIEDRICGPGSRLLDLVDRSKVQGIFSKNGRHRKPNMKIWLLLFLNEWLQQNREVVLF